LPVTKFLFWNINRKPLAGLVAELAEIHRVDVIILAECIMTPGTLLRALNRDDPVFHFPEARSRRLAILTRFPREFLEECFHDERVSIRRLTLPRRMPILLAATHLPSKPHWNAASLAVECSELAKNIENEEQVAGHRRTILVGDFNLNPFDEGLAGGLSSVMSRRVASRTTRTVQGREYRFFYNPMWNHFGDASSETAGSYYYNAAQHVNHYWNIFDQVLLRPELAEYFDPAQVSIIKRIGSRSLVRQDGRPDRDSGSDHLPLLFAVEF